MKRFYFFLSLLLLTNLTSFANHPSGPVKKTKVVRTQPVALVEMIPRGDGSSFVLHSIAATSRPISFMITDSRGVVVMFGDNYSNGSVLNFSHFHNGSYTVYFDRDTNSASANFTVSR